MLFTLGFETHDFGLDGVMYFGFNFFVTIDKNSIEKNTCIPKTLFKDIRGNSHKNHIFLKLLW
jgi:hypothetical protein